MAVAAGGIEGVREGFVDALFSEAPPLPSSGADSPPEVFGRVLRGGFPEVVGRGREDRRRAWFDSYVATILQRDVRDLANIERFAELPRLLSLLAARAASLLNYSDISRGLGMPQSTLKRYMALLEATFLVRTLPPWSGNLGKRLAKSPKLLICDTGLDARLQGVDSARVSNEPHLGGPLLGGPLLENFVAMEIRKQIAWSRVRPGLFHLRTQADAEVRLVLEDRAGNLVGVEVKSSSTVGNRDFRGLHALADGRRRGALPSRRGPLHRPRGRPLRRAHARRPGIVAVDMGGGWIGSAIRPEPPVPGRRTRG